jgi:DNA polymerase
MNDPELPQAVRDLLAIRLQVCTTSTAKYRTLENCVSSDGRLRGTLEFCGAARTGRWAGRKFQPQNLPSRNLLPHKDIEMGIECLKKGIAHIVFDDVMALTSSCIRGTITAPKGKKLVVSDLSNIEGRIAAWLAGEEWKLEAFRALDRGEGDDLYRLAYAKSFNIPVNEVDGGKSKGPQRQIGKVLELFLQYEGGVGAFLTGAATYGIDLDKMSEAAWDSIPVIIKKEAEQAWNWAVKKSRDFGLKKETYVVCDSLKRMWREAHPQIFSYWSELATQTIAAIQNPKEDFVCRKVTIRRDGNWLRIILPSGRSLCYAAPTIEDGKIKYRGINQYSRKWASIGTYGGKELENATQGFARDIMAYHMPEIDARGYEIILTVHDELVTEAYDDPSFTAGILSAMMSKTPPYAKGLPLAAGGFEAYRYRKNE